MFKVVSFVCWTVVPVVGINLEEVCFDSFLLSRAIDNNFLWFAFSNNRDVLKFACFRLW